MSTKLARLLGQESVSRASVALSELVKNAYDADATSCEVSFEGEPGSFTLRVKDNGHGMSLSDIQTKWMVIGTNDKEYFPESPGGRVKVGAKGIGRFAVQRLGHSVQVTSRPANSTEDISFTINWDLYDDPTHTLDQITHDVSITPRTPEQTSGVELVVSRLRDAWSASDLGDLEQVLENIVPMTWDEKKFAITLSAPSLGVAKRAVQTAILNEFLYHMKVDYIGEQKTSYTLEFRNLREYPPSVRSESSQMDAGQLSCGPVKLDLYTYVLAPGGARRYAPWVLKGGELRTQLTRYCGVRIFRDGFRVRPYGDPTNDWMELNAWARDELYAFPNNNVIGTIEISRRTNPLVDTTTREGLIQNGAYVDLRALVRRALQVVIAQRRKDFPELGKVAKLESMVKLEQTAKEVETKMHDRALASKFVGDFEEFRKDVEEREREQISKMGMYRGLASLGISLAAVAHEIAEPIAGVLQRATYALSVLDKRPFSLKEALQAWRQTLKEILKVNEFVSYVSIFTSAQERQKTALYLPDLVRDVLRGYESILQEERISTQLNLSDVPVIMGYRVDFESVLINLVTNSIEVL
ncbi:MAG: sensor histidine kinase, partial [Nitrososphaerota archaeon]|nr:sensor histidine kinase [Nitrososphaerota archaeon]